MINLKSQAAVFILAFVTSAVSFAGELETVEHNKEGLKQLKHEDTTAAEQSFLKALAEDPFNPVAHLNLGWTFEAQKKNDKALKEYEAVARDETLSDEIRFTAHFNAGNAAGALKNIDLALQHYQAALDLHPDSKETKTNIELLMQSGGGQQNQQGEGGGGQDKKDQDGKGQKPKDKPDEKEGQKPKPEFKSEKLSKEDVRKILEELKSQEQKIRALEYGTKGKEASPEKDW